LPSVPWPLDAAVDGGAALGLHERGAGVMDSFHDGESQLKEFVANFPGLDQGERRLLFESLIEQVEIGQKKRVTASLRPPFAFGFVSPDLAPRQRKTKTDQAFVIQVVYELSAHYPEGCGKSTESQTKHCGSGRHADSFAPEYEYVVWKK
jgi:hypothetical protein